MPAILKINPQKKVVYSTFFGVVTDQEFLEHRQTIMSHPDFRSHYDEIVDLTMVTDFQVSPAGMQELAGKESLFQLTSKHAIIAPKDFSFEKAEQFKRLADASRPMLKVVRSAAEAYEILGLE
jgi:hypothetical protein